MSVGSPRYARIVSRGDSLLSRYLRSKKLGMTQMLGAEIAENDWVALKRDLDSLTGRLSDFFLADRKTDVFLVLGRVQSGKTAHLIGVCAWCANEPVSAVVVLSGATRALSRQTHKRLLSDLTSINENHCRILEPLPTAGSQKSLQNFKSEFLDLVSERSKSIQVGSNSPLPIFTVLKTANRVSVLKTLLSDVYREVGPNAIVVVIDDEADQISQNGKMSKAQRTAVNKHLISLQESGVRLATIAYTATPQAILLSERRGRLQPREISTISPGSLYFGLTDVLSERYATNRKTASSVATSNEAPKELYEAVTQFVLAAMICRLYPEVFYQSGPVSPGVVDTTPRSSQMLVHPSGSTTDHRIYFRLVENCRKRLIGRIGEIRRVDGSDSNYRFFANQYKVVLGQVHDDFWKESLPETLSSEHLSFLEMSLSSETKIKVVNSDPQRPDAENALPVSDSEWNEYQNWILIGGDILGRGITIPQLLVTYFLRNPRSPKFDTAMQQMRFCGYRRGYQDFTSVWAPLDVFREYRIIAEVDEALLRQASYWSKMRTDFHRERPAILYLSKTDSRLEPTRKSVIDPELKDHRIKGSIAYQPKSVFQPLDVRKNALLVSKFLELVEPQKESDGWYSIMEPDSDLIRTLVSSWRTGRQVDDRRRVAALFDETLGDYGFAFKPLVCFIRNPDAIRRVAMGQLFAPADLKQSRKATYEGPLSSEEMFDRWRRDFLAADESSNAVEWYHKSYIGPYVGDTQRSLQSRLEYEATCLVIEPISIKRESRSPDTVAQGIALAVLAPRGFQVRMMGFE